MKQLRYIEMYPTICVELPLIHNWWS